MFHSAGPDTAARRQPPQVPPARSPNRLDVLREWQSRRNELPPQAEASTKRLREAAAASLLRSIGFGKAVPRDVAQLLDFGTSVLQAAAAAAAPPTFALPSGAFSYLVHLVDELKKAASARAPGWRAHFDAMQSQILYAITHDQLLYEYRIYALPLIAGFRGKKRSGERQLQVLNELVEKIWRDLPGEHAFIKLSAEPAVPLQTWMRSQRLQRLVARCFSHKLDLVHLGVRPGHGPLYLDDGVPSTHLLPFHLPEARVGDANVLARIEQIASAFEAGAGSAELGPGLLNYHLVTDEWVLATPKLWEGEGGPFGARAPQTRAEYLAVVAALNRHALSWSRSAPAPDSFAERVESKFWGPATQGPGASVHDLQHCVCKGHLGADLFLQLHLWHHALSFETKKGRFNGATALETYLKSENVLAWRLLPPVHAAWTARQVREDYRQLVFRAPSLEYSRGRPAGRGG